ncbi:MAG: MFS transporter [Candidatus Pacebacteria bacterium]|nr:MFS transporter [Candidatus Paceibacterota bacterium]
MENKDISKSNFNKVLQMMSLNSFAMAFVSIFVPIYLIELGYSFQMIMVWMIIHHGTLLIFAFIAVYSSNKIGLVHSLHVRFVLLLLSFLLLTFGLEDMPSLFYIIPILSGAESAFYWIPLNILFIRNTEKESMGKSMSKFIVIPKALSMLSPIIGAFIALQFGFVWLFVFAMILLLFTFVPVLPLKSEKTNFIFSWQKVKEIYRNNKKFFIPEVIDNLAEDAMALWSIFIFLELASTLQVGIIGTITGVASLFFTLTIGKLTDHWDKHKLIRIGAVLVSLIWFMNFAIGEFFPSKWLFYIATIFATLSLKVFLVPYSSLMYNQARKDDAQFIVLREIPTVLGRLVLFSIAIIFHKNLPILFLLIGLIFTYFWFLNTKKLES